jgi:hypothetical protein
MYQTLAQKIASGQKLTWWEKTLANKAHNDLAKSLSPFREVFLKPWQRRLWNALGIIAVLATLMIGFALFYSFFFEREQYLNRKRLIKAIQKHPEFLGKPKSLFYSWQWEFMGYEPYTLILWAEKRGRKIRDVSLHRDRECVICSFIGCVMDRRQAKKLQKLLIALVLKEEKNEQG